MILPRSVDGIIRGQRQDMQGRATMKKVICSIGLALLLLIAGKASAQLVCYQWSIFPFERFKLNIISHSLLTESDEEFKFRHPQ